mmetsp:Transcript_7001/g.12252  ORF Transcript_7001/g.12252 Transcript_7001/m.12252 type:complete len:832 (-) Transcript_7001:26-2521(-)
MSETAVMHDPQQDYDLKKVLGRGSFGAVYFAIRKADGKECAVKRLEVSQEKQMNSVLREIDIMKGVDSPQIVEYYNNYWWKKEIWIVMEFCGKGSLSSVLDSEAKTDPPRGFRDESRIASVACGVLSGLLYMHRRNVVHRDIKSDNVLLGNDGMTKLADFGISRRITDADSKMGTMIGTPHYLAPEVVLAEGEGGYTSKVDVWSLGVVCLEMADGRPPFADLNPMKVLFELANNPVCKLKDPSKWSQMFVSFTDFCCKAQPLQRPSSDHMIKHPFLNNAQPYLKFPNDTNSKKSSGVTQSTVRKNNGGGNADPATMRRKAQKRQAIQLFNKGIEFANSGRHDEAISMYKKALELDPRHVGSLTNLGVAYINKKDYDSAIQQFLLVCEQRPSDANNFVNVGVAYANKKDYKSALNSFEKALKLDPNHDVAKQMQRRCLSDQRKAEQRAAARAAQQQKAQHQHQAPPASSSAQSNASFAPSSSASGYFNPNDASVPTCVAACVQYLSREEEATNLLVFQEQGDPNVIQETKAQFDAGMSPDLYQIGSHNVAGLLWLWFHDLPEPLLEHRLRDRWLAAGAAANEGGHRALQALKDCVTMLPAGSRLVLHALLELLATIHTYQGAAPRLGQFFAQELLWPQPGSGQSANDPRAAHVVELLILYYADLFQGSALGSTPAPPAPAFNNGSSAPFGAHSNASFAPPAQKQHSGLGFGGGARNGGGAPVESNRLPNHDAIFGYYEPDIVFKNFTRDEAENTLASSPGGAYLVRPSSQPNCLSVSYKALDSGRVGHLLLSKPSAQVPGWTTDGRPKPYATIKDLLKSLPYGLELIYPIIK